MAVSQDSLEHLRLEVIGFKQLASMLTLAKLEKLADAAVLGGCCYLQSCVAHLKSAFAMKTCFLRLVAFYF